MSANLTARADEVNFLQTKNIAASTFSLYDLRKSFYGGKVSTSDAIRAYLQTQTGLTTTQSLNDLWRQFFVIKGAANQVSLSDMARAFFDFAHTFNDDFLNNTIASYTVDSGTWAISGGTMNATVSGGANWANTMIRVTTPTFTNFDLLCKVQKPAGNVQVVFRANSTNGYGIQIRDTVNFRLEDFGITNIVTATPMTWVTNSWYWVRIHVVGTHIQARVWLDGTTEGSTWDIDTTNSVYASGSVGFSVENGTTSFDNLVVDAL